MPPVANLIFAVERPNLADLPPPNKSVIVPLRWELLALPELQNYRVINPATWLSANVARRMQEKLDSEWELFRTSTASDTVSDYSFYFHSLYSPLLYWRHIIDSALKEFKSPRVWLPEMTRAYDLKLSEDLFTHLNEFLTWARYATLGFETQNLPIRYFAESLIYSKTPSSLRAKKILELARQRNFLILKKRISRWGKTVRDCYLRCVTDPATVLIVSQPRKSEILRGLLKNANIRYASLSYEEFEKHLGVLSTNKLLTLSASNHNNPEHELKAWLSLVCDCLPRSCLAEINILTDTYALLIHDAPHHPLIRETVRSLLSKGKEVAEIPEGAQYGSISSWPHQKQIFGHHSLGTRFALSQGEKVFIQSLKPLANYNDVIVTGYFAMPSFTAKSDKGRIVFPEALDLRGTRVFLDQIMSPDLGICNPAPSGFEWFPEMLRLIRVLEDSNFSLVSTHRFFEADRLLKHAASGSYQLIYGKRWFEIAASCDLILSFDSSIIVEGLHLQKPVVVYCPRWSKEYDYSSVEKYASVTSDVMRFATTPDEAVAAILELRDSPKKDFHKYEYFLAQEHWRAVDWIKGALLIPGQS